MLNRPTKLRHIVTALIERGRDERPNFAVVHAVDGSLADLRVGSSATLLRNVAILGDPDGVEAGMTVSLRWDDRPGYQSRPMVLAPGGRGSAGVTSQGGYPPDNLTIENSPYGLSVKKGSIGLQHLGFSPALEGHTHKDSLTAHGWQITADGILYSGATAIHPAGQIILGLAPDIVKLDSRHPTYRIWAGDTDPAQAPFSVSKTGAVHATLGDIAGWNLTASEINSDNGAAAVNALTPHIRLGASAFDTGSGFWVGKETGAYKLRIGDPSGSKLVWDGADLVLTGTIYAEGGEIGGWLIGADQLTADTGAVGMGSGVDGWRFWAGHTDPSQAPFRVNNLGEAWLENANIAVTLQSQNYVAGVSGWYLNNNGYAEFGYVRVRGELVSTIFKYNEIQAAAGTLGVFKSASTLSADLTTLSSPNTFLVNVKNDDLGTSLFQTGDILRLKSWDGTIILDNWLTIQATPAPADQGSYTEYTCLLSSGAPGSFSAGTAIIDYGPSGYGSITLSADGGVGYSPNITLATHAGTPWSAQTAHVRIGNLRGVLSIDTDQYGLAAGDLTPTSQNYIKAVGGQVEIKGQIAITGGSGIANLSDAGTLATQSSVDWGSEVGGSGKPADNATVGADWNSNLANIPGTLQSPGAAGLYLTSSYMGYWTGSAWSVYIRNNGYWKLTGGSNYIEWNGTSLTIKGEGSGVTNINGGNIQANTITGDQISLSSYLSIKSNTFGSDGIQLQYNGGNPRFYVGDGANKYFKFDGTNISWKGVNTELTAAGAFTASNANIIGTITASTGTIGGWTINATKLTAGAGSEIVSGSAPYLDIGGNRLTTDGLVLGLASGGTGYIDFSGGTGKITSTGYVGTASTTYDWSLQAGLGSTKEATITLNAVGLSSKYTKLVLTSNSNARIQTNFGYVDIGPLNTSWPHFNTDRGGFYFYKNTTINGTLTATNGVFSGYSSGYLAFGNYGSFGVGIDTNNTIPYISTLARNGTVRDWIQAFRVNTTHNSSNYWRITLVTLNYTTIATINTYTAGGAGAWLTASVAVDTALTLATNKGLYINCAKIGNPGTLDIAGPQVYYE